MAGIAVGQLKMSEWEMLTTDINVIMLAEKAHWDQLKICYGLKPEKQKGEGLSKEEAEAEVKLRNR